MLENSSGIPQPQGDTEGKILYDNATPFEEGDGFSHTEYIKSEEKAPLSEEDIGFLEIAFEEAALAEAEDEVPIGACIVHNGKVIAKAHNTRERSKCATHHAEILAIEEACRALGGWRLPDTTLYVTLEPCAMCAGAIINARIPRVVFSAYDLRFGAFGSLIDLSEIPLNHKPEVKRGVLIERGKEIISAYFRRKRKK